MPAILLIAGIIEISKALRCFTSFKVFQENALKRLFLSAKNRHQKR